MPAEIPITTPVEPTVATAVLLLLQTPPPTELNKEPDEPAQIANGPGVIAAGAELTVTDAVETHVPNE